MIETHFSINQQASPEATVSGEIGLTLRSLVELFLLNTSRKSSMLIDSEDTSLVSVYFYHFKASLHQQQMLRVKFNP